MTIRHSTPANQWGIRGRDSAAVPTPATAAERYGWRPDTGRQVLRPELSRTVALDGRDALPTVVIVSKRRVFADALAHALDRRGFTVAVASRTLDSLLRAPSPHSFPYRACGVLDVRGGRAAELDQARALKSARPDVRVLLLTHQADQAYVNSALAGGAAGVLDVHQSVDVIERSLRSIAAGRRAVHVSAAPGGAGSADPAPQLTRREREVLAEIVAGKGARTVASDFGVSYSTARAHIQNVLRKLGAHSRLEAAALAVERRLV